MMTLAPRGCYLAETSCQLMPSMKAVPSVPIPPHLLVPAQAGAPEGTGQVIHLVLVLALAQQQLDHAGEAQHGRIVEEAGGIPLADELRKQHHHAAQYAGHA